MPHLRTCPKCGAVSTGDALDGLCPLCLLATVMVAPRSAAPENASRGHRSLGNYELLEEIGRGGMGVVYLARQAGLDRLVAVKMILGGHFASRESVQRFQAEAQTAARLRHPNIVALHEVSEHDGQHFFSMDFVAGKSLAELIRDQPLALARAARYVQLTAEAIHYAHEQGILHRDLKPSNILIDHEDQPRISDFGVAKRMSGAASLTLTGQVLGSPNYMPPEQAAGHHGRMGPWSDVYALGAILYQLLTGRGPFLADTVEQTLEQVLHSEPVSPRVLNPALPRDLETICLKCLEKNPQRRYQSARELAEELNRFLRQEPIRARSVTVMEKGWRWCRRRPAVASLVIAVVGLLIAIAFGSTTAAIRIKRAESLATEKLRDSYLAEARARRVSGRPGQRLQSLEAIRKARALNPPPALRYQLRNEAIAALALADARPVQTRAMAPTPLVQQLRFDRRLALYARLDARGAVSVRHVTNDSEVASLPLQKRLLYWIHDFSPNSRLLAVEFLKGDLQVWDFTQRKMILAAKVGDGGCDFSADNRRLTVMTPRGTVAIYDLENGQATREINDISSSGHARFDPSGAQLACFNRRTASVEIRNADTGQLARSLPASESFSDFGWSDHGNLLAAASVAGVVLVWDARTGERRFALEGHDAGVMRISFSHHGHLMASSSWDETTRLWNSFTGRPVLTLPGMSYQMQFSPDDRLLAFTHAEDSFGLIELADHPEFTTLFGGEKTVSTFALSFSPDGSLLANASKNGVNLWDVRTGRAQGTLREAACRTVLFAPDGRSIFTCGPSGLARWRLDRREGAEGSLPAIGARQAMLPPQMLLQAALTPDGKWLAVVNREEGNARVFTPENPEKAVVLTPHRNAQFVALSPDGHTAATGTWGGRGVKIWNVSTGEKERELPTSANTIVEFSPDGRWLITGGEQYQLWATAGWTTGPKIALSKKNVPIGYMAFSPDGRLLAVVHAGRELHLLETATAQPLAILVTPTEARLSLPRFSPDGTRLASVGGNGEIYLWNLRLIRQQLAALELDWSL